MAKKYVYTEAQNGWRGYFGFEQTIDFVNKKVIINWESGLHLADGTTGPQPSPVTIKGLKFFIKTPAGNGIEPHDKNGLNQYTHNVSSEETESEIYYSPFNVGEGSFSIKYDSFYQASFEISFKVDIKNGNNWVECRNKKEGLYDSFILEPGCTEPTSPTFFKVTPSTALGRYIPGVDTTFTFDIRGAKNGVNNNIKEYRVFSRFSYGSTGGVSSFTTVIKPSGEDNNVLEKNIVLPVKLFEWRGATLTFSISSVGKNSNAPSSPYYSSDSFYINRLPDIPTGKNLTILSNETEGHIKVAPGADLDNHSCTVYYNKENETYQQYLSTTKLKPGTYNFKTYDGLEYSDAALGLSITKNQKPVVSSFGVEMIKQGTSSLLKDADSNAFVYAAELKIKGVAVTGNWTSLDLKLVVDDQKIYVQEFSSIKQLEDFIISPLKYLRANNSNLTQYKIEIAANNIEDGDSHIVESIELNGVNKKFCLSPIPESKGYINNNDSNIHYGNEGYFCAETGLTFIYTYDSEYQLDIACNKPFEYGYFVESDAENKNFKVTIISSLSEGAEYKFTPTIYSGRNRRKGNPITLTAIQYPRVTTAKIDDNIILYPLTDSTNFTIRMNDFFQNENEKYGFSAVGENTLKKQITARFNLGGKQFELSSSEIKKEGEIIALSFSPDNIYNALKDDVAQAGRYQVSASLCLTNCFGEQDFVGVSPSFIVSYDSPPTIKFTKEHILGSYGTEGQIALYRYKNNPPTEKPSIEKPFIEGETLSFTPLISGYTKKIKYVIQISRGDTQIWEDYLRGESSLSEEDLPSRNKPKNYNINVKKIIGEIFDNRKCFFRIIVYYGDNNDKMESSKIGPFPRFRLTRPTFELLSSSVDGKNLAISYHLNDIGLDNIENEDYPLITSDASLSLLLEELQDQPVPSAVTLIGSEDAINKWKNFINNEFTISTEIEDSPNYETRLCTITCTIFLKIGVDNGTTYSIKKETSKTIRYYILQPTVAFRKNRIGINTTLIDNKTDAVMIVRAPSSEVRYIYFLSDDAVPKSSEKSIVSWSDIPCIDLKDKTIKNFLVDGGTWS